MITVTSLFFFSHLTAIFLFFFIFFLILVYYSQELMDEPILEIHAPQEQEEDPMEEKSTTSTENLETPPVTPTLNLEFDSDIHEESSLDSNRNSDSEQKIDSQSQQVQNVIPTITDPSKNLNPLQLQLAPSSPTAVSTTASPQEQSRFLRSVPTPTDYREGTDRKKSCASAALALFPQVPRETRVLLLEGMVDFILDFSYATWYTELQEAIISFHDYNVDMMQALSAFQIRPNRSKRFVPTGDHAHSRRSQRYPTAIPPAQPTASPREPILMNPNFQPNSHWRMESSHRLESSNNLKLEIITELTHRNVPIHKLEYILDILTQD